MSNLNNAEVVLVDDAELSKLKGDCSVQVFDDALIKAPKPKKGKVKKAQQVPWGISRLWYKVHFIPRTIPKGAKFSDTVHVRQPIN